MEKKKLMFYIFGALATISTVVSFIFIKGDINASTNSFSVNWWLISLSLLLITETIFPYVYEFNDMGVLFAKCESLTISIVIYGFAVFLIRFLLWDLDYVHYFYIGGIIVGVGLLYLLNKYYIRWLED